MWIGNFPRGLSLPFECKNFLYPISGNYVSDFNDFKSLWYGLHIVFDDFSKRHIIRIILIRFQCDLMRFQTFFVNSQNWRLKSRLTRFHVISYHFLWRGSMISLVNGPSEFLHDLFSWNHARSVKINIFAEK